MLLKYSEIIAKIHQLDPIQYCLTRNYTDGSVTKLSPYISRGLVNIETIIQIVLEKYSYNEAKKLIQELCWREYFQRVFQEKKRQIFKDLQINNEINKVFLIPKSILYARTEIEQIDSGIRELYQVGYIHNHVRMYIASICCNIANVDWLLPSKWMYYHLLDGDIASNTLSWQWVAGTFSKKKYYVNQENINKYTKSSQNQTFLDKNYDNFPFEYIPEKLKEFCELKLETMLDNYLVKKNIIESVDPSRPILIYNSYNIDPLWHKDKNYNRVLLLEPDHFKEFPIKESVVDFIVSLAKANINNLVVLVMNLKELREKFSNTRIIFKEHPLFDHYTGEKEEREWFATDVKGFYPSFFSFWKKIEKKLFL